MEKFLRSLKKKVSSGGLDMRYNPLANDEDLSIAVRGFANRVSNIFDLPDDVRGKYNNANHCAKCGLSNNMPEPFGITAWWYEKKILTPRDKATRMLAALFPWYKPYYMGGPKHMQSYPAAPRCADVEHIARRCGRCGHSWAEFPVDHPGPLEQLARALED